MEIELSGIDAKEDVLLDLQDWVRQEQISGLRIDKKSALPGEEEMGAELLPILTVVLGSATMVQLVKSIHVWLTTRHPKLKIKFKNGETELEIDGENLPDQQTAVELALILAGTTDSK